MTPYSNEAANPGQWAYDFSDSESPHIGTFAAPASFVMHDAADPVGVIASNLDMNIQLTIDEEVECVVVIDRGDFKFDPDLFYAFKTDTGELTFGSCDRVPAGYEIMGRIIHTCVPFHDKMQKKPTGFLEDETEYS